MRRPSGEIAVTLNAAEAAGVVVEGSTGNWALLQPNAAATSITHADFSAIFPMRRSPMAPTGSVLFLSVFILKIISSG
jgi:hypothetical protein